MERKIGEIFEYKGEWYQCVEGRCKDCYFAEQRYLCKQFITKNFCTSNSIFKKLEKVGKPIQHSGRTVQRYKVDKPFIFPEDLVCDYSEATDTLEIEIKQTKEDMEEKKIKLNQEDLTYIIGKIRCDILPKYTTYDKITEEITKLFTPVNDAKLSNLESTGKNLKPFDLEAARKGKPVCTRDGRKARIICMDYKPQAEGYPIIALVQYEDSYGNVYEVCSCYTKEGKYRNSSDREDKNDLMMLPEKHEGWVNVYKERCYETKEEAISCRACNMECIDTIKVVWEE